MAGMLPGVEAARRRRIYQGSGGIGSNQPSIGLLSSPSSHSRRSSSSSSSFSLFSSSSNSNSASSLQRRKTNEIDEKLGQLAREAKERLDERLRAQTKSAIKRNNSDVSSERMDGRREREMRTEVYGTKKKLLIGTGLGLGLGWGKKQMGWKTWEQQECAVCLEEFKVGENVVNLPCAHTFHSRCLVPWLHTSPHCPCCRISIFS